MSNGVTIWADGILKNMIYKIATESSLRKIQELLGIQKDCTQFQEPSTMIRAGIPVSAMLQIKKATGLSDQQMAQTVGMSRRTFSRRIQEATVITSKLNPVESDRLYRLARIIARAIEVFGDEKEAQVWLNEPKQALQGQTPLEVIRTEPGVQQLDIMLGRIEHGIFT